jgi:hypothetical protein
MQEETTIITDDTQTPEETPGAVMSMTIQGRDASYGQSSPAPSRKQRRAQASVERHNAWKKLQRVLPTSGSRTLRRDFFHALWNQGLDGE